jgi:murein DD-endopeptidase MepM/ murein hydrolase activator NlpD
MDRMRNVRYVLKDKRFPISADAPYWYEDSWMAYRDFGGVRGHEGVEIICDKGTPVYAICDSTVEKIGWNTLGGWRLGLRGVDGIYYYYAHFAGYGPNMYVGKTVKRGDLVGYVGSTGYGPVGTDDVMIPHLHVGMYAGYGFQAVNPYPFLKYWNSMQE